MREWNTGYVTANDLKVFYRRNKSGGNKPTILLLHGFTDDSQCWSVVARDLDETCDVVIPDARGHGQTQGSVSMFSTPQLAEDAATIIRELGLQKPFVFGHSMGALTTLALAASHPELVRAAVLEDPPLMTPPATSPTVEQLQKMAENRQKIFALHDAPKDERRELSRLENPTWPEEELLAWADAKGEYNREMRQNRSALTAYPWRDALTQVQCPVLLITSDTGKGGMVTAEVAQEVPQLCPSCEVVYIAEAGHCIHREQYSETMQHVWDFLKKN